LDCLAKFKRQLLLHLLGLYCMFKAFPPNLTSIQKPLHDRHKPMSIVHSPHSFPYPYQWGSPMGIPIPTAALHISLTQKGLAESKLSKQKYPDVFHCIEKSNVIGTSLQLFSCICFPVVITLSKPGSPVSYSISSNTVLTPVTKLYCELCD